MASQKEYMTGSNEVFFPPQHDYNDWKAELGDYQEKRNNFQGKPEKVSYVKENAYKARETKYNPIL